METKEAAKPAEKDTKNTSSTPDATPSTPAPVKGSPVTAGTKSEDPGKGGTVATEGNKSTSTVAPPPGTDTPNTRPEPEESPTPTEAELDAIDREEWKKSDQANSLRKVRKLVHSLSASPDSHSIYGYGGTSITLGDLRNVVANMDLD